MSQISCNVEMDAPTDCGRPERKKPSLHGRKFTPTPKFLGTAKAYFVCQIGPVFQISLIYAFIGCPQSVFYMIQSRYKIHCQNSYAPPDYGRNFQILSKKMCHFSLQISGNQISGYVTQRRQTFLKNCNLYSVGTRWSFYHLYLKIIYT